MIVKTGAEVCLDRCVDSFVQTTHCNLRTESILLCRCSVQELTDNAVEVEVLETLKEVVSFVAICSSG